MSSSTTSKTEAMSSCHSKRPSFHVSIFGLNLGQLVLVASAGAFAAGYMSLPSSPGWVSEASLELGLIAVLLIALFLSKPADKPKSAKKLQQEDTVAEAPVRKAPTAAVVSYDSLITACAKAGDFDGAEKYLKALAKKGKVDIAIMKVVIGACVTNKCGDLARAEAWIPWMLEQGVKPDTQIYNLVITAFARTKGGVDLVRAEAWIPSMLEEGVEPDAQTYNCILNAYARKWEVDRTEAWLNKMWISGTTPNQISYSIMIRACAQVGAPARAEAFLADMQKKGIERCAICYSSAIQAWANAGDINRCKQLIDDMMQHAIEPDYRTYDQIIDCLVKAGDLVGAEAWMAKMEAGSLADGKGRTSNYTKMLCGYAKADNVEGALAIFERMCRRGVRPKRTCCNFLLGVLTRKGDVDAIVVQLRNMRHGEADAAIWADRMIFDNAIRVFSRAGDPSGLPSLLQEMLVHGWQPDKRNHDDILCASARNKDSEKAEAWLNLLFQKSLKELTLTRSSTYSLTIQACLQAGDKHRAGELVHKMDVQMAERWLEEMHSKRKSRDMASAYEFAFNTVVQVFAREDDAHRAVKWFEAAMADGFEGTYETYDAVVGVCMKVGRTTNADSWLRRIAALKKPACPEPIGGPPGLFIGGVAAGAKEKQRGERGAWAAYMEKTKNEILEQAQLNAAPIYLNA